MKKVEVVFRGWGQAWTLGTLAQRDREVWFEYSPDALARGLELSPLHVPLRAQAYGRFPDHLGNVPGFIADALPDGWGLLLMDRVFRKAGRDPTHLTTLDRLSFIADRAMGALAFQPASDVAVTQEDLSLLEIAQAAHEVIEDRETDALRTLAFIGGSPQGARPKAITSSCCRPPASPRPATRMAKAFQRCVFNVIFNNRDDHAKNFALRMNRRMEWQLAPAFDLTFNVGPGGYHQMSVMGEALSPGRTHLDQLAKACDLSPTQVSQVIDAMCEAAQALELQLDLAGVRKATRRAIGAVVEANVRRCLKS